MQQVLNQVSQMAQKLVSVIWQVLQFIWNWSFGQIVKMFQMPFNTLPLWKQVLFVLVNGALGYFFYKIAKDAVGTGRNRRPHLRAHRNAATDRLGRAHCLRWRMGPD